MSCNGDGGSGGLEPRSWGASSSISSRIALGTEVLGMEREGNEEEKCRLSSTLIDGLRRTHLRDARDLLAHRLAQRLQAQCWLKPGLQQVVSSGVHERKCSRSYTTNRIEYRHIQAALLTYVLGPY